MIGLNNYSGKFTRVPFVVALVLLWAMAGCGGDEQETVPIPNDQVAITDDQMVPEHEYTDVPEEIVQAEEGELVAKPFSPPAPMDDMEEFDEPIQPKLESIDEDVVVTPVRPERASFDGALVTQDGGDYSIMVGSFVKEKNAGVRAGKIEKLGFRPVRETAVIAGQEYFRVHLRGIASYDEAESLGFFLKEKLGFDYLVLKR